MLSIPAQWVTYKPHPNRRAHASMHFEVMAKENVLVKQ
jgi:hypothetical protein